MVDVRELVFSTPTLLPKPTELFLTPTPLLKLTKFSFLPEC